MIVRSFWLLLGLVSTGMGIAGILLPLLPTTPFLLLAVFAFARSSPQLHAWLLKHPRLGAFIRNWQRYGSIDRNAKAVALLLMVVALGVTWIIDPHPWVLIVQLMIFMVVAVFILTRPDGPPADNR